MKRLMRLANVPPTIKKPQYNRDEHGCGIVHLGIGAFHRGHMAVYTDDAMAIEGGDWCITGVSLRSPTVRDRLDRQNGLYSVLERSENQQSLRVIGCLKDVLVAPENPTEVLRRLIAPKTCIVSMTITEKGYLHDPASGALMCEHPDILHDLSDPENPKTMHGYVVESLARRRQNGDLPFVLLSCDNLPTNGDSLKRVILDYAKLRDRELASWIDSEVIFPNSMVDRIVPPTTPENIDTVSQLLGCCDKAPVICEPFSQWVIEEKSQWIRPAWEKCGVEFVPNVIPFEEMKLRLLNGSHSAMAYLGYLAGFEYIHQVITDQGFVAFIQKMMSEEIIPTLRIPPETDLLEYGNLLIQRFRNPTLHHSTWQIAMDGSLKLPQRLLDPIRDRITVQAPYPCLALAVAGWFRYITGINEKGTPIDVSDPIAEKLSSLARQHNDDIAQYVKAVLQLQEIFGKDLSHNYTFQQNIINSLKNLYTKGAKNTVYSL